MSCIADDRECQIRSRLLLRRSQFARPATQRAGCVAIHPTSRRGRGARQRTRLPLKIFRYLSEDLSQAKAGMVEEVETQLVAAADAVQSGVCCGVGLVEGVGAQVGQFGGFEVAPDQFDWIEVVGVAGQ